MERSRDDKRGRKLIFVSHCILNQNAKVRGIAKDPGVLRPVAELLVHSDAGIYQMPCPEMTYLGAMRWGHVKDQYDSPMFRKHCRSMTETVLDQVEDYQRSGYRVLGFLAADGSPVCGLNTTAQPSLEDPTWGGMVWYVPRQRFVEDSGVFCQILQEEIGRRGLGTFPFVGVPEVDEAGRMDAALTSIREILR
jgi:predicted secreted protein